MLEKSNGNLFAIAFKSEKVGRAIILEREPSKKKQRIDTKKDPYIKELLSCQVRIIQWCGRQIEVLATIKAFFIKLEESC